MDIDAIKSELGVSTMAELADRLKISRTYLHDLREKRRGVTVRFAVAVNRELGREAVVPPSVAKWRSMAKAAA